jgi:hypothetical protein
MRVANRSRRNKAGKVRSRALILREDFLSKEVSYVIIEKK